MVHDYYMKGWIADIILGIDVSSIVQEKFGYGHVSFIDSEKERGLLTSVSEVDVRAWANLQCRNNDVYAEISIINKSSLVYLNRHSWEMANWPINTV